MARRVLVTGGARRLGRAIAVALAGEGDRLAIHYHESRDAAAETERAIVAAGGQRPIILHADLRDAEVARTLPGKAADGLGGLDVLINSAAVLVRQPIDTVSPKDWDDDSGPTTTCACTVERSPITVSSPMTA